MASSEVRCASALAEETVPSGGGVVKAEFGQRLDRLSNLITARLQS